MQRALIAGVLVGILASYYGVFVIQRGLGFLGSGLAHAAFGGVALGILLEQEPLLIAVPFTIFVAIGITYVKTILILPAIQQSESSFPSQWLLELFSYL